MARTATRKRSKTVSTMGRARAVMSREARGAYGEVQQGVKQLERSIADVRRGLAKAEHRIEADARARVRELRKDARAQLALLRSKEREAARMLKHLSAAVGESWREIKQAADAILHDARTTVASVVKRLRGALGG